MRRTSLLLVLGLTLAACAGSGGDAGSNDAGSAEAGSADDVAAGAGEASQEPTGVSPAPSEGCVVTATAEEVEDPGPWPWDAPEEAAVAAGFDTDEIISGGPPPDGIRPIDEPCVESIATADQWLDDDAPVLVVEVGDAARAYPLAIMTQHEIANDSLGGEPVLVTYCPLCNSGLAFERTLDGEVVTFGTSGRLFRANLVMYDRPTRTLWSQFTGEAVWGDEEVVGTELTRLPTQLLGWAQFRAAHPEGTVLSRDSVPGRTYGANPYVGYDGAGSNFLFQGPEDPERLDPDARVVGVGEGEGAVAVPLERLRDERVVEVETDDGPVVLLWAPGQASALDAAQVDEGREVGTTGAFVLPDGLELTPDGDGRFTADGVTYDVTGQVVEGEGEPLQPVPLDDTFWFVWFAFQPETSVAQ